MINDGLLTLYCLDQIRITNNYNLIYKNLSNVKFEENAGLITI